MHAGLATLKLLTEDFYHSLNRRSRDFADQVNAFFLEHDIDVHLAHYHSMMSLRFRTEEVMNYDDAQAASGGDRYLGLFQHLLINGIYWPPADLESFFVSGMHGKHELSSLLEVLKTYFHNGKISRDEKKGLKSWSNV